MQKLKIILRNILCVVYGWLSGVYVPVFIAIAFNVTKGVGNNPDGIMFIPLGILLLLAIFIIDILIIVKTVKSNKMTRTEKVINLSLFVLARIAGLMVDQNGWRNLVYSFRAKFIQ